MRQIKVFAAGDEVCLDESCMEAQRLAKFKGKKGIVKRRGKKENSYIVRFEGESTALMYQDELTLLTDARIAQLDNRVKDLEVIALEVAGFEWKEDYIGVESTYVQVMFPRALIMQARRLMNYPPNTGESKDYTCT